MRKKKTAAKFMCRQGDVLVFSAPTKTGTGEGWKKQPRDATKRVILAAGEVTGHHHAIHDRGVCYLRKEGISDAVVTVPERGAELVHEEHSTISIPSGRHYVRIQREWGGEVSRRVED